jgi:N6-L-threonylcarbamoyladenine synthase
MLVLGIESTCDETAASVVRSGKEILSNVIRSQIEIHIPYGGVFPELACRRHIDDLIPVIDEALIQANTIPSDIDLIAVAKGPGLMGALLIGVNGAKALALAWNKPFVGVNHVEAHLYAAMMGQDKTIFPALGVVVSGGHTFLVKMTALGTYELIGTTVDDALGEAFDKVAALLGLPYPGGPAIEQLAKHGDPSLYSFKPGRVKGRPFDFSFSGLKTNVLYTLKGANSQKDSPLVIPDDHKRHIAAAFQETALMDIVSKSIKAYHEFNCRAIYLGGGVSNNNRLRDLFKCSSLPLFYPPSPLTLDNAAMIAGLGYHLFQTKGGDSLDLSPLPRIPLANL